MIRAPDLGRPSPFDHDIEPEYYSCGRLLVLISIVPALNRFEL